MNALVKSLVLFSLLLPATVVRAQQGGKVGDVVWAEWVPNMWYHGKIGKIEGGKYHIDFDDGDKKAVEINKIAPDRAPAATDVKVGTPVLAKFRNLAFFPGKISQVMQGGQYGIQFDDGDTDVVPLVNLRLIGKFDGAPPAPAQAWGELKAGDIVWAEWVPNMWYHGKVARKEGARFHIDFDDGDKKAVEMGKIARDLAPAATDVKVGTPVLAKFKNVAFFPGKVAQVNPGGTYRIQFDDGDVDVIPLANLRLIGK
jgi:hypothetical protein